MGMRRLAREIAVQALYEVAQSETSWRQALDANVERRHGDDTARAYAARLLEAIEVRRDDIRDRIDAALANWSWERVALVDRCVLQVAAAELLTFPDVPLRVSIDEAVEIARKFSTDDSGAFVNGVLDRIAHDAPAASDPTGT
jgi:N utilization substance protein B